MAIARRIIEATEAILFVTGVLLLLLAAPVLFALLFAPQTWANGTNLTGLHDWPDPPPAMLPRCACPGELDVALSAEPPRITAQGSR